MAFSAGFSPHPKVSYVGAAPTGVASEAEYLEIGLSAIRDPMDVRTALDAAFPPGLDVVEVVEAATPAFAERMEASRWRIAVPAAGLAEAVRAFLAADSAPVERLTKNGRRTVDARAAVVSATLHDDGLDLVVRITTPAVRADDVLTALAEFGLRVAVPPLVTRLAQGPLRPDGTLADPLEPDRTAAQPVSRPSVPSLAQAIRMESR